MAELYESNMAISRAKNSDYANASDPFNNFTLSAAMSKVPVERGLLVRMSDKFARISELLDRPAAVTDESILDTLSDLANYSMILRMWLEQKNAR